MPPLASVQVQESLRLGAVFLTLTDGSLSQHVSAEAALALLDALAASKDKIVARLLAERRAELDRATVRLAEAHAAVREAMALAVVE